MKYGFIIDNRKCIGCHACTTACKSEHEVPVGVFRTWVKQVEKGNFPHTRRVFSVMRCNHCTDAPCVEICPVEALFIRPDGIVDFDKNRCIGCKSCMQACPYDALYIDPDTRTAAKCNYCAHRVDIGLEPACVNVCPEHAIISGDMDNPQSEIAQLLGREQVTVRKPEKGTLPNLFYINGDQSSLVPAETSKPATTLWGGQERGVGHFAAKTEKLAYSGEDIVTATLEKNGAATTVGALSNANGNRRSIDAVMGKSRRVYDSPDKGILWGWEVSAYVWTKAIATGAFLIPLLAWVFRDMYGFVANQIDSWLFAGGITALIFLAATGALLVKDLDQPGRFLYVLLRPQWNSWLVRGGYAITAFGATLTLSLVLLLFGFSTATMIVLLLTGAAAVLTAVYTAFLFAQAKGRDFWQSPALGFHMLIHSLLAGASVFALGIIALDSGAGLKSFLEHVLIIGILLNLLTLVFEIGMPHPTTDARNVVKMITTGPYARLFVWGVLLAGNMLPLLLLMYGSVWSLVVAGALIITGIFLTEKIWVEAPQRIKLS